VDTIHSSLLETLVPIQAISLITILKEAPWTIRGKNINKNKARGINRIVKTN